MPRIHRTLFVCLGNICRSPTAEGVARARIAAHEMDAVVDSAGTSDWHIGHPPYGPAIEAARARGIDLSDLRARQFSRSDFSRFDLIVAMDRNNLKSIEMLRPKGLETPVRLMSDYADGLPLDVPDPYYTRDFEETLDIIERAIDGLVVHLSAP